jgi:hypothetical protein
MRSRFILLAVLLYCRAALAVEEKEFYPDGTLHSRAALDAQGRRRGQFVSYFPGGKRIQEQAHYEDGKLDGPRQLFDEKGIQTADEVWAAGRLVIPKSEKMIEMMRVRILRDATAYVEKMPAPTNKHAPPRAALAQALGKLRMYRYLCDVAYDVSLDDDFLNLAQSACDLLDKTGKLSHDPIRPSGVSDEFYKLGLEGCQKCNLGGSGDVIAAVDGWMDDGDAGNIDRLGHRRWMLSPKMGKTGFGAGRGCTAMYSIDGSREDAPSFDFVAFPPSGCCPLNLCPKNLAWHVTLNPEHYGELGADVKAEIYAVDGRWRRSRSPLELEYAKLNRDPFGIPNALIFRPKSFAPRAGATYEVVVKGLRDADGKAAECGYMVRFY